MPIKFDLMGMKFGRLTVVGLLPSGQRRRWFCKCDCGGTISARSESLRNGDQKSCGCTQHPSHDMQRAWEEALKHRLVTSRGCWEYTGARSPNGYGHRQFDKKTVSTHRLSAAVNLGFDLDSPLQICHHCDNPPCFNPEHLFVGTGSDNIRNSVAKGRQSEIRKTHCPMGHPYNAGNTRYSTKRKRTCVECANDGMRRRHQAANPDSVPRGKRTKASLFRGVSIDARKPDPWRARIMVRDKELFLGYFQNERDAARAYNEAARLLLGSDAQLNQI